MSQLTLTSRHRGRKRSARPCGRRRRGAPSRHGGCAGGHRRQRRASLLQHAGAPEISARRRHRSGADRSRSCSAIALAYPERRFSFVNDGRLVFQSTGSGDLLDVLVKIYGMENAQQMVAWAAAAALRHDRRALDTLAAGCGLSWRRWAGTPTALATATATAIARQRLRQPAQPDARQPQRHRSLCQPALRGGSQPHPCRGAGVSHAAARGPLPRGRRLCRARPGAGRCERASAEDAGALCRGAAHLLRRAEGGAPHRHQRGAGARCGRG